MRTLKYPVYSLLAGVVLAGCGGGGGSGGESSAPYTISLRAEKTSLPLNVQGYPAGIGAYHPYTTTLYVQASQGGQAIADGSDDTFACDMRAGLDTGALYYLDGKSEHETSDKDASGQEVKRPTAYRSITLGANSGGNSFHFHAGDKAGVATIACTVTDPRDKKRHTATVNITVGAATGMAASIETVAQFPAVAVQGNAYNYRTATAVQVFALDDANQPLPNSTNYNMLVNLLPGSASAGARLLSGTQSGSSVTVNSVGGVGQFAFSAGTTPGTVGIEVVADRADNNVSNGIQDPIKHVMVLPVVSGRPAEVYEPLTVASVSPPAATVGLPYSYFLSAAGGAAPYAWAALGELPAGLGLSQEGLLSGTPTQTQSGTVPVALRVIDSKGASQVVNVSIAVTAPEKPKVSGTATP